MTRTILERHAYAPELNKIHINRAGQWHTIKAPGIVSIRQWRDKNKPVPFTRRARLQTFYPAPHTWLDRTHGGCFTDYKEALQFKKYFAARLSPAHGGTLTMKTYFIGNC